MSRPVAWTWARRSRFSRSSTNWVSRKYAVVMVSSEMMEIIGMCDRAVIIKDGRSVGELQKDELTELNIIQYAMGVKTSGSEN